jgi:hypothetical protein
VFRSGKSYWNNLQDFLRIGLTQLILNGLGFLDTAGVRRNYALWVVLFDRRSVRFFRMSPRFKKNVFSAVVMNRVSLVSEMTGCRLDYRASILGTSRDLSLSPRPDRLWAHLAPYIVCSWGFFPGSKAAGAWNWTLTPSKAEIANAWRYVSTVSSVVWAGLTIFIFVIHFPVFPLNTHTIRINYYLANFLIACIGLYIQSVVISLHLSICDSTFHLLQWFVSDVY